MDRYKRSYPHSDHNATDCRSECVGNRLHNEDLRIVFPNTVYGIQFVRGTSNGPKDADFMRSVLRCGSREKPSRIATGWKSRTRRTGGCNSAHSPRRSTCPALVARRRWSEEESDALRTRQSCRPGDYVSEERAALTVNVWCRRSSRSRDRSAPPSV